MCLRFNLDFSYLYCLNVLGVSDLFTEDIIHQRMREGGNHDDHEVTITTISTPAPTLGYGRRQTLCRMGHHSYQLFPAYFLNI